MRLNEIYPGLVGSEILITQEGHSWRIWLWETQADLARWADNYSAGRSGKLGEYADTLGLHSACEVILDGDCQHVGELHFIKDVWDLEHVAHECTHALFHFIRALVSDFPRRLYMYFMDDEEEVCYPFGQLVDQVYRWLWKKNPNPKWTKESCT